MKPKNLGLALTLGAFSSLAAAQSSVTVWGILDLATTRFTGAPGGVNAADVSVKRLDNGVMSTSRIGFRGTEDLGGGLAASFELGSFLRLDTGETGRNGAIGAPVNVAADPFWSQSSWVGLSSRQFGRVRLGNFGTPMWIQSLTSNAFGDSTTVSPINMVTFVGSPLTGGTGWTNQVAYDTPNIGGFFASVAVSASEGNGGRNTGARLAYVGGPLTAGLAYQNVKKNPVTFADGTSPNNTKAWQLAAAYDFGVVKVFGHFGDIQNDGTEAVPLNVDYKVWDLSAAVPLGAGNVLVGYASRKTGDAVGPVPATAAGGNVQRQMLTVGYDYLLSKRTDAYLMVMNDKTQTNTLPAPGKVVSASATNLALGIRHRF
jgi:predicted porin